MKKVIFFSGAGLSAESGIPTFRDADGLWEGHDPMKLANISTWNSHTNRDESRRLMLDFYNGRRRDLHKVEPNGAHKAIAEFSKNRDFEVINITQNIDDLLERAGVTVVHHLHGELFKGQSTKNSNLTFEWKKDMNLGDKAPDGSQMRPNVVWFGEAVPMMQRAANLVAEADIVVVVGTSLSVYPAAMVFQYVTPPCKAYYVNKEIDNKAILEDSGVICIEDVATAGVKQVIDELCSEVEV